MKKVFFIAIICLLAVSMNTEAQLLNFGIKGGVNFPSLNSTDGTPNWDSKTGWHAGAMLKVNIPIIQVQGEVLYSQSNFNLPDKGDFNNTALAIPITAQISLLKILTIHAGPQFGFLTSSKLSDVDIKSDIENNNFNFVAGAGIMLGSLDIHGRFIFPSKVKNVTDATTEYKNSNVQLSVGYWFK